MNEDLEKDDEKRKEDLQFFFKKIIGGEVEFENTKSKTEEDVFIELISSLEESIKAQDLVLLYGGIDVEKITGPLWYVIETYMNAHYGEEAFNVVMWYMFARWDEEGNEKEWEDLDGKTYKISSKEELWKFIEYNFL